MRKPGTGQGARDAVLLGVIALLALTIRFDFSPPATDLGTAFAANEASIVPFQLTADPATADPAPAIRPAVLRRHVEHEITLEGPIDADRLLRLVTRDATHGLRVMRITVDAEGRIIVLSPAAPASCPTTEAQPGNAELPLSC